VRNDESITMSSDCIFCKIVAGEIPATVIAESPTALAFADLAPQAPVHVLVIPKTHVTSADHLDADTAGVMGDVFLLAQEVAEHEEVRESGYRLVVNVGRDAQMTVPHLHVHLMGGRQMNWPAG
jgi:histidine triad (HIT) family protein